MINLAIQLPNVLTFKVRGHEITMDLDKAVDANAIATRLALYGLRKFNDASPMGEVAPKDEAGKEKFALDCANNAREMVKDWLAGEFETERSGGGRTADPVQTEANMLAKAYLERKHGVKFNAKDETHKELYNKYRIHPDLIAKAKELIARRNAEAEMDLDV